MKSNTYVKTESYKILCNSMGFRGAEVQILSPD
jgi:hypothetical protein